MGDEGLLEKAKTESYNSQELLKKLTQYQNISNKSRMGASIREIAKIGKLFATLTIYKPALPGPLKSKAQP